MTAPRSPLRLRSDVSLGPVQIEYAERMSAWMSTPVIAGNLGLRGTPSLERTLAWIQNAGTDQSMHAFAILIQGRHVGNVVLDQVDLYLKKARFSIYLGEADARGKGAGITGTYLALKTGFEELDLYKIWLTVHIQNTRAIQTYLNAGFRKEGQLRGEFLVHGARLDAWYMGILAEEFANLPVASTL